MLLGTRICNFGQKTLYFILSDPESNRFAMSKNLDERSLLIAFICNHYPYVVANSEHLVQRKK